jgi:hypothetical protein
VITSYHSYIGLILDSFLDLIRVIFQDLAVFDQLNGLSNCAANWIIQSESDQVNEVMQQFLLELWIFKVTLEVFDHSIQIM